MSGVVRDNPANVRVAVKELGWEDIRCFGHTLHLAVNSGLAATPLSRLVGAAHKLVSHFKYSVVVTTALKQKQQQMNLPEHHLIQNVTTRWNSMSLMLQ